MFHNQVLRSSLLAVLSVTAAHANSSSYGLDREITRNVEWLISEQPTLGSQLSVQTKNGVVYIAGTPATRFGLLELERKVRQTDGIAKVVVTAVYPED